MCCIDKKPKQKPFDNANVSKYTKDTDTHRHKRRTHRHNTEKAIKLFPFDQIEKWVAQTDLVNSKTTDCITMI